MTIQETQNTISPIEKNFEDTTQALVSSLSREQKKIYSNLVNTLNSLKDLKKEFINTLSLEQKNLNRKAEAAKKALETDKRVDAFNIKNSTKNKKKK